MAATTTFAPAGGSYFSSAASEAMSLRRAARLVHCLQKERGASCALCAFAARPAKGGGGMGPGGMGQQQQGGIKAPGKTWDDAPPPPLMHPLTSSTRTTPTSGGGTSAAGGGLPRVPLSPPSVKTLNDISGGAPGVPPPVGGGAPPRPLPLSPRRESSPRRPPSSSHRPLSPPRFSSGVSFSEDDDLGATRTMLSESLRCARRNADAAVDLLFSPPCTSCFRGRPESDLLVRESLRKIRALVDSTASCASGFDQGRPAAAAAAAPPSSSSASALSAAESAAAAAILWASPRPAGGGNGSAAPSAAAAAPSPLRPPPSPVRSPERSAEAVGFHRILVAFNALVASVTHVCIVQRCDALKRKARGEPSPTTAAGGGGNVDGGGESKKAKQKKNRGGKAKARTPKKKTNSSGPLGGGGGIGGLLAAYDAATTSLCGPGNEATVDSKKTADSLESESTATSSAAAAGSFTPHRASSSLPIDLADGGGGSSSYAAAVAPGVIQPGSPPKDMLPSQYAQALEATAGVASPPSLATATKAPVAGNVGIGLPPRGRTSTVDVLVPGASAKLKGDGGKNHRKAGSDFVFCDKKGNPVQRVRTTGGDPSGNIDNGTGGEEDNAGGCRPSSLRTTDATASSNRASSLVSLLLSFVRLKESTGVERAVLSSLMVMGGGGGGRQGDGGGPPSAAARRRRRKGGGGGSEDANESRQHSSFGEADSLTRGNGGGGGNDESSDDGDGPDPFERTCSSVSDGAPGFVGGDRSDNNNQRLVPSMLLFSDLVLEEENRRRIVRELRRRAWDATTHGASTHRHDNRMFGVGGGADGIPMNDSFRKLLANANGGGGGGPGGLSGAGNASGRQRRLLYDENYKSLLALVDQAVRPSPEMEYLHNTIRVDFNLRAFQRAMSLEEFWAMITAYIDRLHALELLIVEELECCLATAAAATSLQIIGGSTAIAPPPRVNVTADMEVTVSTTSSFVEKDDFSEEKKSSEDKSVGTTEEEASPQEDGNAVAATDVTELLQALNLNGGDRRAAAHSKDAAARALAGMRPEQLKASLMALLTSPDDAGAAAAASVSNEEDSSSSAHGHDEEEGGDDGDGNGESPLLASPLLAPAAADIMPPSDDDAKEWEIDPYELEFRKRIGRGVAGTTYLAHWSGQKVAVKVAAITDMGLEGWNTEVRQLQRLHHPNVIRFLGSIYNPSPRTYGLVLEYCDNGDLSAALSRWTPPSFFFRVAGDVANGMAYLHGRRLLHRDIKPANILLHGDVASGNFTAKLTDFGVATITQSHSEAEHTAETGTYRWMAPEVIRHEAYNQKADVYSYALVAWQLITREEPFCDRSQIEAAGLVALESARPPFPPGVPSSISSFIERCWSESPDERQSFDEIKNELRGLKKVLTEAERNWIETAFGHAVYEVPAPGAPAAATPVVDGAAGRMRSPPHRSKSWHEGEKQQYSESESSDNEPYDENRHGRIKGGEKKKSSGWGFLGKKKKRNSFTRSHK